MAKLLVFAAIAILGWKMLTGRWPWQAKPSPHAQALDRARKLLDVTPEATRAEIQTAHKRRLAIIHPDRGGTNAAVHETNAARDLLLSHIPQDPQEPA